MRGLAGYCLVCFDFIFYFNFYTAKHPELKIATALRVVEAG